MKLYGEARRRGVFRVAATYLVVAWLVLEVGHVLSLILELPHIVPKVLLGMLVLGFPVIVGLGWTYRITADGWVKHPDLPETEPASRTENAAHRAHNGGGHGHGGGGGVDPLPIIMGVLTMAALVLLVVIRMMGGGSEGAGEHGKPVASAAQPGTLPSAAVIAAAPVRAAPPNSIAVLPFANVGGDPSQDYFSDGLSEEVRSTLASFSDLHVAARTSSAAFKGGDARATAAKLGVAYILEGSVRRSGDTVRISAELVEAATGFQRWSQTFDRQLTEVFKVESEISAQIGNALKVRLLAPTEARGRGTSADPAAFDAYLRGRQQYDLVGDEATYQRALVSFDAAIAADPGFAAARAARARTLIVLANQFSKGDVMRARFAAALAEAERAVQLAPTLAEAQSTLGFALYNRLDFAGAARAYDKANSLSSGDADQLVRYGLFKARMGDFDAAHAALEHATLLDPLNPRVPRAQASAFQAERRYADVIAAAGRALALNPAMNGAQGAIGEAWLMRGDIAKAKSAFSSEPQALARLGGLAIVEYRLGHGEASRTALAELVRLGGDNSLYQQAQVLAQTGQPAAALDAAERAVTAGDTGLVLLRNDPLLDPLRADPRFAALKARLKFPA